MLCARASAANPPAMLTFRKGFESFYWLQLEVRAEQISWFSLPPASGFSSTAGCPADLTMSPVPCGLGFSSLWCSAGNFCPPFVLKDRTEWLCLGLRSLYKHLKGKFSTKKVHFCFSCFSLSTFSVKQGTLPLWKWGDCWKLEQILIWSVTPIISVKLQYLILLRQFPEAFHTQPNTE